MTPNEGSPGPENYEILDADKIIATIHRLSLRIQSRFPDSGLYQVSLRLLDIARQARERAASIARPLIGLRVATFVVIAAVLLSTVVALIMLKPAGERVNLAEFIQTMEAGINDVVLIGLAVFFLFTIETRVKRKRALAAIHEIRVVAHIIDIHQLTKDPDRVRLLAVRTEVSPKVSMSRFELGRYLDYCSEMLSLAGKVAALYVQSFEDSVAIASVNDVEQLTTALSRKIWQKIMILPKGDEEGTTPAGGSSVLGAG